MLTLWHRLNKRTLFSIFVIALLLPSIQAYPILQQFTQQSNSFHSSPYTLWMGIDSFHFASIAYYLVLPLIAALPAATLLKKDLSNGFFMQVKLKNTLKQVLRDYYVLAFLLGGLIVTLPLLVNFTAIALKVPSTFPDNLLNQNILVINRNTLLVSLYYTHPFVHYLLNLIMVFLWGGLYALFTTAISLNLNNRFFSLSVGLLIQMSLLLFQGLHVTPYSLSPADFLKQTAMSDISLGTTLATTIVSIGCTMILLRLGREKLSDL
ncbi:hypothetical protein [Levilactobacillus lindianensis]|uniref:hypothetical protein n=1 Tax=Levilactobacillus lindianensis TaxID=2486018 RepID=UPI000F73AEEB|nr:hypothetical protein [Levilactobacillus lindianensis]